jgi:hypothetical protein
MGLLLHVQLSPEGVGLSLTNPGPGSLVLARGIVLEDSATQRVLEPNALVLQLACEQVPGSPAGQPPPKDCLSLGVGAELMAPASLGRSQTEPACGARLLPKAPGHYQLRVRTCDGQSSQTIAFSWPAP